MTELSTPRPFRVEFAPDDVGRIRRLLADTRLPATPPIPGATWDYGVDLHWLKSMRDAWLNEYDWRAVERRMNTLNHFKVTIEGIELHYLHHKSEREDAIPIILTHGWPGPHISVRFYLLLTTKSSQVHSGNFIISSLTSPHRLHHLTLPSMLSFPLFLASPSPPLLPGRTGGWRTTHVSSTR